RRALDLVHLCHVAVDEARQRFVQRRRQPQHAADQVVEVLQVGDLVGLLVGELGNHLLRGTAGHLPGVDRLQRAPAGARTLHRIDAARVAAPVHATSPAPSRACRLAISIATIAASSPLLPWLPPARASASACASTASTPLHTGTPCSSATRIRPSAQPSATCS